MSPDLLTMTKDYPFPLPTSRERFISLTLTWKLSLLVLILLVLVTLAVRSFAMDSAPMLPLGINHDLPGSKAGILTKAQGAMLHIDRVVYALSPLALVEDRFGTPLTLTDIQSNDVEYRVLYWVATDRSQNQIVQLVVSFPE
jgi:hypothetical protein